MNAARRLPLLVLLAATLVAGPGCGVLTMRFLDQDVHVNSLPRGARIFVDGQETPLVTPAVVPLDRAENHTIWVEKEGYERPPNQLVVRQVKDWIVVVDVAFAFVLIGFVFLFVDDSLGSDSDLTPDKVHFELRPLSCLPSRRHRGLGFRSLPALERVGSPEASIAQSRAPPTDEPLVASMYNVASLRALAASG